MGYRIRRFCFTTLTVPTAAVVRLSHYGGDPMKAFSNSGWKLGGEKTASRGGRGGGGEATDAAHETQPLISGSNRRESTTTTTSSAASSYPQTSNNSYLRERRKSPVPTSASMTMKNPSTIISNADPSTSYTRIQDDNNPQRTRSGNISLGESSSSYQNSNASSIANNAPNRSLHSVRRSYVVEKAARDATGSGDLPPLVEIPEEIYAVRKAALQVLKPLTRTWVSPVLLTDKTKSFWCVFVVRARRAKPLTH